MVNTEDATVSCKPIVKTSPQNIQIDHIGSVYVGDAQLTEKLVLEGDGEGETFPS